jgi:broad specificity phosphatase PhoE
MKVYFIRHGQTDFNKEGRVQGQEIDMPLNEIGISQAEKAIEFLPEGIDVIISSPLNRAFQTAEIINSKYNVDMVLRYDIQELKYGSLAGKNWQEIEEETCDADIRKKDVSAKYDYRIYGGESVEDVKERVKKFVEYLKENYEGKQVLVSTHGGIIEALQSMYLEDKVVETKNCEIHEFNL